ncbi:hypothetical protein I4U23_027235 [Adineta vaga]|nr:hypothetical protein I4U23_027235 [Adineta vaga]
MIEVETTTTTVNIKRHSKSTVKNIIIIILMWLSLICFLMVIISFFDKNEYSSKNVPRQTSTPLQKRPTNIYSLITWSKRAQTVAGGNGQGTAIDQLAEPNDMFVDKMNNIYIADSLNHRIMKWTENALEGDIVAGGNGQGNQTNQLNYPTAIFVDSEENLYIADNGNNRIVKWPVGSEYGMIIIGQFGRGSHFNQLDNCSSIYVDKKSNIYISELVNHRITKWSPDAPSGQLLIRTYAPSGIYIHERTGDIYVTSYLENSVKQFQSNGFLIRQIGKDIIKGPISVITREDNLLGIIYIYIADSKRHRILQIQIDKPFHIKAVAGITNEPGNDENQLNKPNKIQFDSNNNLLVLDSNNQRVQKFQITINNYDSSLYRYHYISSHSTSSTKSTILSTQRNVSQWHNQINYNDQKNSDNDDIPNEKQSPIDDTFFPQPGFEHNRRPFDIDAYQDQNHKTWQDSSVDLTKSSSFRRPSFRKG